MASHLIIYFSSDSLNLIAETCPDKFKKKELYMQLNDLQVKRSIA